MVKIRLKRCGRPKEPVYRIIVCDSRKKRDGKVIETLGHYDPKKQKSKITLDNERYDYWIKCGAQPSDIVSVLVKKSAKEVVA
ncbi:MAG: 30S ribosomal protein S16 [Elusimicrobia bacterium RIFOXYA2_FULL_39_19]|nr:MAG: 30S ribosomal protein S16 [Elusimicrobia bacterium RIFOXYA2_FULL_39_19]